MSAFNYREGGEYKDNSSYVYRNINVGIMEFPKMRNLSREEYHLETQRRQKLSAIRTVNLRDKEKNKEQLLEAKKHYIFRKQEENYKRVLAIVSEYEKKGKKINFSKIGELSKLDRKTVKKYYEYRLFEN